MDISREDLSARYAALSDAELLAIDPNELTDLARLCYQSEVAQRRLPPATGSHDHEPDIYTHDEVPSDWLETAATACSFQTGSGRPFADDAERACTVLRDAGIPCHLVKGHEDGEPDVVSVMVPGALSLKATSILDRDLFNEELEETWRAHFDELSDQELRALRPDDLCAGLLDRAARLKRVYEDALARRRSGSRPF